MRIARITCCGDAEAALVRADIVVEGTMETPYVEHADFEAEAGVAWMDGDTLVIQACIQAPMMDRGDTARVLGLPPARVGIIPAAAGSGFGSKLDVSLQSLIGLIALKTGRPARMVYGLDHQTPCGQNDGADRCGPRRAHYRNVV